MDKKERKTIKCSYALLVIVLFATVAILTDYIIIERKVNKCGNISYKESIDDSYNIENDKNITSSFNKSNSYKLRKVDNINYMNDNISNIKFEKIINDEFGTPKLQIIITANNKDEIVWQYSFDELELGQSSRFDLISVVNDELFFQYNGKLFIMNLNNGSIVEDLKYNSGDYYISDIFVLYEDSYNIYIIGKQGGSSTLNKFAIIDKENRNIKTIINTIEN